MRQIELLAPAPDRNTGIDAINFGADAVYIGAQAFSARSKAGNSVQDINDLVEYAHPFHVKVFVAFNTLIRNNELHTAEKLINQLIETGIDGLIIQDPAVLKLHKKSVPLIASTQFHNFGLERIKWLESAGFARAILAREHTIDEISEIRKNTTIELETFIHGSLCSSFSGRCYLSHSWNNRSGNRGECAQVCRLPFSLYDKDGKELEKDNHILSLKDLNLSENLAELIDAGVTSLKIEGRLQSANHIKNTVYHYRKLLDEIFAKNTSLEPSSHGSSSYPFFPDPQKTFSRGYSQFFLKGRAKSLTTEVTPKSIGEPVGRILSTSGRKAEVILNQTVNNGDGICFVSPEGLFGFESNGYRNGYITASQKLPAVKAEGVLYRNKNIEFNSALESLNPYRKIDISIEGTISQNLLAIKITDESSIKSEISYPVEYIEPRNPEQTYFQLKDIFSGNNSTIYKTVSFNFKIIENNFLPRSIIKKIRKIALNNHTEVRESHRNFLKFHSPGQDIPVIPYPGIYSENIANEITASLYRDFIEMAPEAGTSTEGKTIYHSRYCIRYETGRCFPNNAPPLFLKHGNVVLKAEFHCDSCTMTLTRVRKENSET